MEIKNLPKNYDSLTPNEKKIFENLYVTEKTEGKSNTETINTEFEYQKYALIYATCLFFQFPMFDKFLKLILSKFNKQLYFFIGIKASMLFSIIFIIDKYLNKIMNSFTKKTLEK